MTAGESRYWDVTACDWVRHQAPAEVPLPEPRADDRESSAQETTALTT